VGYVSVMSYFACEGMDSNGVNGSNDVRVVSQKSSLVCKLRMQSSFVVFTLREIQQDFDVDVGVF